MQGRHYRLFVFFIVVFLILVPKTILAQSTVRLLDLVESLSKSADTSISYSPTLLSKVIVANDDLNGTVTEVLNRILKDTEFSYRKVKTGYFIYPDKSKLVADPLPKIISEAKPKAPAPVIKTEPVTPKPRPSIEVVELMPLDTISVRTSSRADIHPKHKSIRVPLYKGESFIPRVAVKTNLLYDMTSTINLGAELCIAPHWSIDVSVNGNPWQLPNNYKIQHFMLQPEFRYWPTSFAGQFLALHTMGAMFDCDGEKIFKSRKQGFLVGAGIGYGYRFKLAGKLYMEAELGIGYAYISYNSEHTNWVGPTKAALSLVYIFN